MPLDSTRAAADGVDDAPPAGDTIVVLLCPRSKRMAKTIRPGGEIVGYDSTKRFAAQEYQITGLGDLGRLLASIARRPRMCVLRGALINGSKASHIRRLKHPD